MPRPLTLFFRFDKVYVNFGRAKHLLRLEDVKFAHQIDQRLRRTLITLQGLVLRDLDHSFRKTYLALLPLHPDRDRLQQRCHKVGRGAQTNAYVNEQIKRTGYAANGRPLRCYIMQLTADGANVKTALVGSFGAAFKGSAAKAIPSPAPVAAN
jgi:hypothetical protein